MNIEELRKPSMQYLICRKIEKHQKKYYGGTKGNVKCSYVENGNYFVCSYFVRAYNNGKVEKHHFIRFKHNRLYGIEGFELGLIDMLVEFYNNKGV